MPDAEASRKKRQPDYVDDRGTVILTEIVDPPGRKRFQFVALMTRAPVVVAGYGGWSRVARPKRKAITEWVGRDSVSVSIAFVVDVFDEQVYDEYVEDQCRDLESMAGVEITDPEPPLLRLESKPTLLMPHGYARASHVSWFVENITWDAEMTRYSHDGNRVRAGGEMILTQFVADVRVHPAKANRNSRSNKRGKYTVRKNDSLTKIAARKDIYGDATKWKRIAKANNIRDPKSIHVGQVLKIPR